MSGSRMATTTIMRLFRVIQVVTLELTPTSQYAAGGAQEQYTLRHLLIREQWGPMILRRIVDD